MLGKIQQNCWDSWSGSGCGCRCVVTQFVNYRLDLRLSHHHRWGGSLDLGVSEHYYSIWYGGTRLVATMGNCLNTSRHYLIMWHRRGSNVKQMMTEKTTTVAVIYDLHLNLNFVKTDLTGWHKKYQVLLKESQEIPTLHFSLLLLVFKSFFFYPFSHFSFLSCLSLTSPWYSIVLDQEMTLVVAGQDCLTQSHMMLRILLLDVATGDQHE